MSVTKIEKEYDMSSTYSKHSIFDPEAIKRVQEALPKEPQGRQPTMNYFLKPEGRRLNEYEQLIGFTMQSGDQLGGGIESGDFQQKHPGGRGAYVAETTELRSSDWWVFRDPNKNWFFPYVKAKSEEGRHTDRHLAAYSASGDIRGVNPEWLNIVEGLYGGLVFMEYGLFNAHSSATKDSLSDFIKMWIAEIGFDKNDAAQMVQTQRVFINKILPSFPADLDSAKHMWMQLPVYSKMRETVQELWQGTYDWAEIIWSVHGVFDPIVGQFMRREFFSRLAPLYGDNLTPWIQSQAQDYAQTAKLGTKKLMVDVLSQDETFGAHNATVVDAWTEKWLPDTIASLKGFMAAYEMLPYQVEGFTDKKSVEASVRLVLNDWVTDFAKPANYSVDVDALVQEVMSGYKQGVTQ